MEKVSTELKIDALWMKTGTCESDWCSLALATLSGSLVKVMAIILDCLR